MTLRELENQIEKIRSRPLILLCRTPTGEECQMTVQECMETGSAFIHVVRGNDLDDLDTLLAYEFENIRQASVN